MRNGLGVLWVIGGLLVACGSGTAVPADAAPDSGPDASPADAGPPTERLLCGMRGRDIVTIESLSGEERRHFSLPSHLAPLPTFSLEHQTIAIDELHGEVFVAAYGRILVFARDAKDHDAPLRALEVPPRSDGFGGGDMILALDAAHDELVIGRKDDTVLTFAHTASGTDDPLRTLAIFAAAGPYTLALDPVRDEIAIGDSNQLVVYARTAAGSDAALRTHPSMGLRFSLDTTHAELVVARLDRVETYAWPLADPATPLRQLMLDSPPRGNPALDSGRDELWLAFDTDVRAYSRTVGPTDPPTRAISFAAEGYWIDDLALDGTAGELFVGGHGSLHVFARTAQGPSAPLRSLLGAGEMRTGFFGVDLVHDELLVTHDSGAVSAYAREAVGEVAPLRILWGIPPGANGVKLDAKHGELLAQVDFDLLVLPRAGDGFVAPLRKLEMSGTVEAVDPHHDELWTVDSTTVAAWARQADGSYDLARSFDANPCRDPDCGARVLGVTVARDADEVLLSVGACYFRPKPHEPVCNQVVRAFPRLATDASAPLRHFSVPPEQSWHTDIGSLQFDESNDRVLVTHGEQISVFPRLATGTPRPMSKLPIGYLLCN